MKKIILVLLLATTTSIYSCDKKNPTSESPAGTGGTEDIIPDENDTSGITAETDTFGTNPNK